jgi:hypothetical protein
MGPKGRWYQVRSERMDEMRRKAMQRTNIQNSSEEGTQLVKFTKEALIQKPAR